MHKATKGLVPLVLLCLLLAGCAGVSRVPPGEGKTITTGEITYDQLWLKVLQVVTKGFDIKEIDKKGGFIRATQGHWGVKEYIFVYVTALGGASDRFQVEVISTRKSGDFRKWDEIVLADIKGRLASKSSKDD